MKSRIFAFAFLMLLVNSLIVAQNGSVNGNTQREAASTLTAALGSKTAIVGDTVVIPVNVENFINISAITFKIQTDTSVLRYTGTANLNSQAATSLIGYSAGTVTIAWDALAPLNITSGKFIDLKFKYLGGTSLLSFLTAQCVVADVDGNELTVSYVNGSVSPGQQFVISTSSNPIAGGIITGGGNFLYGQTANLRAAANPGYTFVNWTDGANIVSTNPDYSFAVVNSRNLVANFLQNNYQILTSSSPANGGTATGGGSFTYGQTANLKAVANTNYQFVNWTEGQLIVSTSADYSFTVTGNRNLTANFALGSFTISTGSNPADGGTTSGSGNYVAGQTARLSATANTGFTFVNWTEGQNTVSTASSYSFTVTNNRALIANFSKNQYTISAGSNPPAGGTITGSGVFTYGQTIELKATPNTGYTFVNWTEGQTIVSSNSNYSFTVINSRTLVANFSPIGTNPSLVAAVGNVTAGIGDTIFVPVNVENFKDVSAITFKIQYNTSVLQFIGAANWNAQAASGLCGALNGQLTIAWDAIAPLNITSGKLVDLKFKYLGNTSTLNFNISQCEVADVSGSTIPVSYINGSVSQNQSFLISTSSNPDNGGATTGSGEFASGQTDTVKATPSAGYTFVNWTEGQTVVSTNMNYGFIVTSNRTLTANFSLNQYTILTNSNPTNGGTTSGSGTFTYGQTDTVKATPNAGYTFVNWTEGQTFVSTNINYGFIVTSNRTLTANFAYNPVLTLTAPRGGEVLFSDSSFSITWQSAGVQNISIVFSSDNGGTWSLVANSIPASSGIYPWTVPQSVSGECKIKIYDPLDTVLSSISNAFKITEFVKIPELISPQNNSVNLLIPVTLLWHKALGASKYIVELSADSLFSNLAISDTSVIDTFKIVSALQYNTKYFWRVISSTGKILSAKSDIWNFKTIKPAVSISGLLTYANNQNSPMPNVGIYLTRAAGKIDSLVTDEKGAFEFKNLQDDIYNILPNMKNEWSGVNSTDALLIRRVLIGTGTFDTLQAKAADVNESGTINSTDALLIRRRIADEISAFLRGDWVAENPQITVSGMSVNINIRVLCSGDVNGSFVPVTPARPVKKEIKEDK